MQSIWAVRFYQRYLSRMLTSQCSMHPSCSRYCVQAIRKHGVAMGIVLTADRMLHEADAVDHCQVVRVDGRLKLADPVEANDSWWCAP